MELLGYTHDPMDFSKDWFIDKYCIHSDVIEYIDWIQVHQYGLDYYLIFTLKDGIYSVYKKA